ncbi:MAG TPA: hypothetical protein VMO26_02220 [Vicinamibacterales bacterium]|nr:hypothetical protein [Vicinamibacterales bacterium]
MTTPSDQLSLMDPRSGVWMVAAATLLALGLVLHALFPRYALTPHGSDGEAVVVFDRWTGQFQQATYGPDGEPRMTSVVRPF